MDFKIGRAVRPDFTLPFWDPLFPALRDRSHAPLLKESPCGRMYGSVGGTATIRNSPGVYGSAYDAPDVQYGHRAKLGRSSERMVYNSVCGHAWLASSSRHARESRARSNAHLQMRVAGHSFDVVKDDHST